jgi:O-succinylbenzoic acid--CoA ligase
VTEALSGLTPDWLRQRASSTPERPAVMSAAGTQTFKQLDDSVTVMTEGLLARGVQPGQLIGLLAANSALWVAAVHAVARAGCALVPLNLRLAEAEMAWQLQDCEAQWLLVDGGNRDRGMALVQRVSMDPERRSKGHELNLIALEELDAFTARESRRRVTGSGFELAATQSVLYTSGTTGRPKGVTLTFGNHFWSATASALNLGLRPDDRWLACLPLFHAGGLAIVWRSVIYRIPMIVHESFDPLRVNRAIDEDGVTMVSVVANMLQRMLDERRGRPLRQAQDKLYPASLRCVLLGGGPAAEPLLRECVRFGVPVVQTYGLTETASQVATLDPRDALRKVGSAGKPLFGLELRIVSDSGEECSPGAAGEIVVRGPTVTQGYLKRPEATAAAIRDGWLYTGDIGCLDDEGYLYVLDRRDDLIVSGGENVYPAEVESVLELHPDVREAGVYGCRDERWGQVAMAVVVPRAGATASPDEIIAFCRERLAGYKTPVEVEFASALPRNAAGKLLRRALADRAGRNPREATRPNTY